MCAYLNLVVELFDKIDEQNTELQKVIENVDANPVIVQDFSSDFQKIKSAFSDFQTLAEKEKSGLILAINDNAVNEDEVSRARHDMRAKIGAVQSYSQLILEEIEYENKPNKELSDVCNKLIKITSDILPIIAAIKNDSNKAEDQLVTLDDSSFGPTSHSLSEHANQTVLIVDDSEYNRDLLQRRLMRSNINVLTAINGQEGLDVISKNKVDLIILDIMMPVLNGYDTLKQLKANGNTANIPVLMISAIDNIDSVVKCIEIGAEDYLSTPFNTTMLNARVKTCLDKKRALDKEDQYMQEVINTRQRLSSAIESIDDGFAIFDANDCLTMCNEKFRAMYPSVAILGGSGFSYEDFIHKNIEMDLYLVDRRSKNAAEKERENRDLEQMKISRFKNLIPYMEQLSDGSWLEVSYHQIPTGGFVSLHKDVTQRHKDEERLKFLALNDPLTGIANRASFNRYLETMMTSAQEHKTKFGLLYLDLDGFKAVNDNLGHEMGDEVLKNVASKMQDSMRSEDLVARLGGDEFVMLLNNTANKEEIIALANRLLDNISENYDFEGQNLHVGVSIGIAIYPDDGYDPEVFLAHADQAMYAAKKAGKGQYKMFSEL